MNVKQQRYYESNKRLLCTVGLWPYQSKISSYLAFFNFFVITSTSIATKVAAMVTVWPDVDLVIESVTPVIFNSISYIKTFNFIINFSKMRQLLDTMLAGLDGSQNSEDTKLAEKYAERGRSFTVGWMWYVMGTIVLYSIVPLIPQMFGTLGNNTKESASAVYYPIDMNKYYYPIYIHTTFAAWLFLVSLTAANTIYCVFVEYACAMFSMLGYRLRQAVKTNDEKLISKNPVLFDDEAYKNYIDCIKRHVDAIKFSELIDSAHSTAFIFTVILNMLIISTSAVYCLGNLGDTRRIVRQFAVVLAQIIHLYVENYYAQKLLDHSNSVYTNLMISNWYEASPRAKKIMYMFTMRSLEPCHLTIGGINVMSLANFSSVLRLSASYFTVLRSFQQ